MSSDRQKILIVEDSPTMCQLYRMVLGTRPATELVFAVNGVEGLDRLAQESDLHLMIVDINMPKMDGLEFLRRARSELGISVPSLVISTEGDETDRLAATRAGATGYIRKPWKPNELLGTVDDLIGTPSGR